MREGFLRVGKEENGGVEEVYWSRLVDEADDLVMSLDTVLLLYSGL